MLKKLIVGSLVAVLLCSVFSTKVNDSTAEHISVVEPTTITTTEFIETTTQPPRNIMTVTATAYCPCEKCCGKWSDGITASGTTATEGRTVAVDKNLIPLGTEIIINGKTYIAEDTGSAILGNKIDIYFDSHSSALEWGKRTIEIEVLLNE